MNTQGLWYSCKSLNRCHLLETKVGIFCKSLRTLGQKLIELQVLNQKVLQSHPSPLILHIKFQQLKDFFKCWNKNCIYGHHQLLSFLSWEASSTIRCCLFMHVSVFSNHWVEMTKSGDLLGHPFLMLRNSWIPFAVHCGSLSICTVKHCSISFGAFG